MDVLTPEQRRLNMSRIRGRNTKPELQLRRGLHKIGFRFQLHVPTLPGKPDLVFPKYRAVLFVQGCFWHGHNCPMFKLPTTRASFWRDKISANRARDQRSIGELKLAGWRVLMVWECALRGPARLPFDQVLSRCAEFIRSACRETSVSGS